MTLRCAHCGRPLKHASPSGMGPVCARAVLGSKPPRIKREDRKSADERQRELWQCVETAGRAGL